MKTQKPIPKPYPDVLSFKSRKQTQTRSTINSGRSTNYDKRNSHDISYQTQILRNLNKSAVLCLNNHQHLSKNNSISHKVIIQNRQKSKKVHQSIKNNSKINEINMKKTKKQVVQNKSKNKTKSNSLQSFQAGNKFHSHRQSFTNKNVLNPSSNTYRVNSQDKQNICSNKPQYYLQGNQSQSVQKYKTTKPLIDENKLALGKLTFIIEKDFKQKKNLTKKRLLLSSNQSLLKENLKHRAQKDEKQELFEDQNQIRKSSKSNNSNKLPFGSGRVHSIQKKKENLSYLKAKSIQISQGQSSQKTDKNQLLTSTVNQVYLNNKKAFKENFQSVENSIETSQSVSHQIIKPSPHPSRSSYSIKSFLKELMHSQESNENKIKKIIDCMTPEDMQSVFAEQNTTVGQKGMPISQNVKEQTEKKNQFCLKSFFSKINEFQQHNYLQKHESIKGQVSIQKCKLQKKDDSLKFSTNKSQENDGKMNLLLKFYQGKIIDLYEQLIKEKEKRYQLEQMIEKYIIVKSSKSQKFQLNY